MGHYLSVWIPLDVRTVLSRLLSLSPFLLPSLPSSLTPSLPSFPPYFLPRYLFFCLPLLSCLPTEYFGKAKGLTDKSLLFTSWIFRWTKRIKLWWNSSIYFPIYSIRHINMNIIIIIYFVQIIHISNKNPCNTDLSWYWIFNVFPTLMWCFKYNYLFINVFHFITFDSL